MPDYVEEFPLAEPSAEAWRFSDYADPNRNYWRLLDATQKLRALFATARQHRWNWQHAETVERAVLPLLTLLNVPRDDIRQTTEKFAGSSHRADIDIRNPFRMICVIEVKKWGTSLHRTEHYLDFYTPLDQGLYYFDRSSAESGLITNGVDWWLIRQPRPEFAARGVEYVAVRFRLDEALKYDQLPTFLGLFDYNAMTGRGGNKNITYRTGLLVHRKARPFEPSPILLSNFGAHAVGEDIAVIDVNAPDPFAFR